MNILVRYHALIRDKTGTSEEMYEIYPGGTARKLTEIFCERYPLFEPLLPSISIAVNDEFATLECPLRDGDIVDLLPPFGGG